MVIEQLQAELSEIESSEESAINDEEYGYNYNPKEEGTENIAKEDTKIPYRDPLRKIAGGRVLQYPIDLDTDIQDYFEIQIFKYLSLIHI